MKNIILFATATLIVASCKEKTKTTIEENVDEIHVAADPKVEGEQEWTVLFNGTSFDAWKEYNSDNISNNWKIEDGAMVFSPSKNESHNLVTKTEYTDFVLSLEWKISKGGNSGIFWGVHEDLALDQAYRTGPEIQVLDNQEHPDAKNGNTHQAGALYDMVAPSKDLTKPVGEWNVCVITVDHKNQKGSVNLNGTEVVAFPVANGQWNKMVSRSKFADWEHFGKYKTGKIGLQDHGDKVSYKNIKIKKL